LSYARIKLYSSTLIWYMDDEDACLLNTR